MKCNLITSDSVWNYCCQAGPDVLAAHVVPMVVRAFEDPDARMQEEVLKRTLTLTKQLDFTVIISSLFQKKSILQL
jgi:SCY1-like protein 2